MNNWDVIGSGRIRMKNKFYRLPYFEHLIWTKTHKNNPKSNDNLHLENVLNSRLFDGPFCGFSQLHNVRQFSFEFFNPKFGNVFIFFSSLLFFVDNTRDKSQISEITMFRIMFVFFLIFFIWYVDSSTHYEIMILVFTINKLVCL